MKYLFLIFSLFLFTGCYGKKEEKSIEKKYAEYGINFSNEVKKGKIEFINGEYFLDLGNEKIQVYSLENRKKCMYNPFLDPESCFEEKYISGKVKLSDLEQIEIVKMLENPGLIKWFIGLKGIEYIEVRELKMIPEKLRENIKFLGLCPKGELDITKFDFPNIEMLHLMHVNIENFSALSSFKKLEILFLDYSFIMGYSFPELGNLRELRIEYLGGVENFEFLEKSDKLEKLAIGKNSVGNLDFLKKLTKLEELSIWSSDVKNIEELSDKKSLKKLFLDTNEIEDIRPLESLTELEQLAISNNPVGDYSILKRFSKLNYLSVNRDIDEKKLQEVLPEKLKKNGKWNRIDEISARSIYILYKEE